MSEYTELSAEYCPHCPTELRDAWHVPLAAAPKEPLVATLDDGHVEIDDSGLRVYLHAENGGDGS
jgi:hypothetical protein